LTLLKPLRKRVYTALCRFYAPEFVMVTGCQRSGTTLVFMMLAAHPGVTGYDESETDFSFPSWRRLRDNRRAGCRTCIKHPMATPYANWMKSEFPRAHNLFVLRHPFHVISSMRRLVYDNGRNWLENHARYELNRHRTNFPEIEELDFEVMSDVEAGAYVWRYKIRVMEIFRAKGLPVHVVKYEDLLTEPEARMRSLLSGLGLSWHDNVLSHERFQSREVFAGGSRGDRPLDANRKTPELDLSPEERENIHSICENDMEPLNYTL
ncbi:MAG: sulfotransferase, partial [Verrucomicrobiota bacterium]